MNRGRRPLPSSARASKTEAYEGMNAQTRQHPRRKHTKQRAEKSRTRRVRATCIGYPPVGLLRDAHTTRQCHRQPYYVVTVNLARVGEGGAVSGEHNHGGHFWVRHVSSAHSRSACGATRFLHGLLLAVACLASLGIAARFPQVDDPICYLREAGHDPACCCRLAFGRLLKRTVAVSSAHAPAKKRPRRGKRSLTLDATRSLPREDPP